MKYIFIFLILIFIPLSASTQQDNTSCIKGWFKLEVRKNKWVIFNGTKECYLIMDTKNKKFSFGSIYNKEYHIRGEFSRGLDIGETQK